MRGKTFTGGEAVLPLDHTEIGVDEYSGADVPGFIQILVCSDGTGLTVLASAYSDCDGAIRGEHFRYFMSGGD